MSFFIVISFLRHLLTARNTHGHGVHSPYLYRLLRDAIYDKNSYYCFAHIELERKKLLQNSSVIAVQDFGIGGKKHPNYTRTVASIAKHALMPPQKAQKLFRLATFLQQPLQILELGTSLGITTAYLANTNKHNHIITLEGAPQILAQAKKVWNNLKCQNIQSIIGNINQTLPKLLQDNKQFQPDLVIFDANHTQNATIEYFNLLLSRVKSKTIFFFDDIHSSPGMQRAWHIICQHNAVTTAIDFFHFGLIFFDTHYLPKTYRCL